MKTNLLPILVCSIAFFAWGSSQAQEPPAKGANLFTNGSFADGMQGWIAKPKPGNTAEVDKTELRDGRPTLKIFNAKGGDTMVWQKIAVKPKTRYKMTGYIKTMDVIPDKPKDGDGASLAISGGYQTSQRIQKTKPWAKVELEFESGNQTEMTLGPRLGQYNSPVAGSAWFADVMLVEVGRSRK
jgi:hypothetical protein